MTDQEWNEKMKEIRETNSLLLDIQEGGYNGIPLSQVKRIRSNIEREEVDLT